MGGFSGMLDMFYILTKEVVTQVQTLIKTHQNTHLKAVHFSLCKLHLSENVLQL